MRELILITKAAWMSDRFHGWGSVRVRSIRIALILFLWCSMSTTMLETSGKLLEIRPASSLCYVLSSLASHFSR